MLLPEIVIGTTNPAKARQCRALLERLGVAAVDVGDVLADPPQLPEDGASAAANAAAKAATLASRLNRPVIALDYGLVFEGIPDAEQPGLAVRRLGPDGGRASDEESLEHYSALIRRHGGTLTGRWEIGAAIASADGAVRTTTTWVRRTFVADASPSRVPGHPLASLQYADTPPRTYVSELTDEEEAAFFGRVLDEPLGRLVAEIFSCS